MTDNTAPIGILLSEWQAPRNLSVGNLTDALTPLLGKPMLQRSLEYLVRCGCKVVHVFLGNTPGPVQALLDNGERWGVQITFHYYQEDFSLAENLRRLSLEGAQPVWLACDDTTPFEANTPVGSSVAPFCTEGPAPQWAGVACLPFSFLLGCGQVVNRTDLEQRLLSDPAVSRPAAMAPLSCGSDAEFLRSVTALLQHQGKLSAGRGAFVHPSAVLQPPVYIGHQVRIGPNARIGPNVVIEDRSVIDGGTEVRDSVVLADTYVGHELSLDHCVVHAGSLARADQGVLLPVMDPILLAPVRPPATLARPGWRQRLALKCLRIVAWPLYRTALRRIRPLAARYRKRMVAPLASGNIGQTQRLLLDDTLPELTRQGSGALPLHFALTFYPGLAEVLEGRLSLWGPDLRNADDVAQLPSHWRALYQNHRAGLLSPEVMSAVSSDEGPSFDRYLNDVAAVTDPHSPFKLIRQYLIAVSMSLAGKPAAKPTSIRPTSDHFSSGAHSCNSRQKN